MALQGIVSLSALAIITSIPAVVSVPTKHFEAQVPAQVSVIPSFVLQYGQLGSQFLLRDLDADVSFSTCRLASLPRSISPVRHWVTTRSYQTGDQLYPSQRRSQPFDLG